MIRATGFHLHISGRPWEITGNFVFEDEKELGEFRAALHKIWHCYVAGDFDETIIKTFEEYQEELEKEEKTLMEMHPELEDDEVFIEVDEHMEGLKNYSDNQLRMEILRRRNQKIKDNEKNK